MIRNNRTQDFFADWQERIMVKGLICLLAIGMIIEIGFAMEGQKVGGSGQMAESQTNPKLIMEYKLPEGEEVVDVIFGVR